MRARLALVLASGVLAFGCRKAPKLEATAVQKDGVVEVAVTSNKYAEIRCAGKSDSGMHVTIKVPALSLPLGPQKLAIEGEERGKVSKIEVPFDRQPVPPALELTFTGSDSGGAACGGPFCKGTVKVADDGVLNLSARAAPGTKVEIGGQPFTIGDDGSSPIPLDLKTSAEKLGLDLVFADKASTFDEQLPVKVTADGSKDGPLTLKRSLFQGAILARAADVAKGPVSLGAAETPAGPRAASLLYVYGTDSRYFGKKGVTLGGLDLVAIPKTLDARTAGTCGPYDGVGSVDHVFHDKEVTVYDRRTGAVKSTRKFPATSAGCPMTITTRVQTLDGIPVGAESGTADEYVKSAPIEFWLRSLVPRG